MNPKLNDIRPIPARTKIVGWKSLPHAVKPTSGMVHPQETKKSEYFNEEEREQFQDIKRTEIIEKTAENSKDKERGNSEGGLKHIDIDV